MSTSDQTINLPQLVLVLIIGGLAYRYFFYTPSNSTPETRNANNARAREADVERIMQMFPQADRRSIMWDLQRNGGNLPATTERILSGRGLEVPPQSFQPPLPVPTSSATPAATAGQPKAATPDLITRYNLKNKLEYGEDEEDEDEAAAKKKKQAWSQNKAERQALLQKRRDEMILKARRQMEARVAKEGAGQV